MKIYVSKFWPFVTLVFSAFWLALLGHFVVFVVWYVGLGNSVLGFVPIGLILLAMVVLFMRAGARPLRLARIPVLNFMEEAFSYRQMDTPDISLIPYKKILSVEITENLSKYAPSMLTIVLDDGSSPIRLSPQFNVSNEVVMNQFEMHCAALQRKYSWQWKYISKAASQVQPTSA